MIAIARAWRLGEEADGRSRSARPAKHVDGELRPREVGDEQVEEAGGEVDVGGRPEQERRREIAEPVVEGPDRLRPERLLGGLQLGPSPRSTRRSRSTGSSTRTGSGPRIAVSLLPSSPCSFSARTETGTRACSSRSATAIPRSSSQRRRAALLTASDDVVDGAADRVLDPFEFVEAAPRPAEVAVGTDLDVERHLRRRLGQRPADLSEADRPVGGPLRRAGRLAQRRTDPADHPSPSSTRTP